jgi:hypothetical protein
MSARLLALATFLVAAEASAAATRLAPVAGDSNAGLETVLDSAIVLLSKEADLQLLDRAEVSRVLREQELTLDGLVRAEHALKAGQLLRADLLAVLEGTLTNGTSSLSLGLVVFDARTGVRYADSALVASNTLSAASATVAAVQAAVAKAHRTAADLKTVGLLSVRNADLPRQYDGLCDSVGLLLERELTASPGIAVLERRRLEQISKERSMPLDAEGNRLLTSLRTIELDISQDGAGLQATLALVASDGSRSNQLAARVPSRDGVALAHLLAGDIAKVLEVPAGGVSVNRKSEAIRFHHEYSVLFQHHDYATAVRALDAALALAPEEASWRLEMAGLLPFAAIEFVDPGGQNWVRSASVQPSPGDLASCLALGQRGIDLLLGLSREAAAVARAGEPTPEVLKETYHERICQLLYKLAGVYAARFTQAAEVAELVGKERTLRMEVLEPFLRSTAVDETSFDAYSRTLQRWLSLNWDCYPNAPHSEERAADDILALSHWAEVSHKLNPPDASGEYLPISTPAELFSRYPGERTTDFLNTLERDKDPVIRIFARAGRVACSCKAGGYPSDDTLAAEREFRLYAQDLLAHDPATKAGYLRNRVWGAIFNALQLLLNHPEGGTEYLAACRFAFDQGDIQPALFQFATAALDNTRHRKLPEELEVVEGALKLVVDKPDAFPNFYRVHDEQSIRGTQEQRDKFIRDWQKKRDLLASELGMSPLKAPSGSRWKQSVCVLDLVTPDDKFGWLFKPVAEGKQVFAVVLGFRDWKVPERHLQLVRVQLEGGSASFLGATEVGAINPIVRYAVGSVRKPLPIGFVRTACMGGGCYCAATDLGVFMFPTNGGPVERLGAAEGLPCENICAIAFLDGKLYIGASEERAGYLAAYDFSSRKIVVLASSRRSEHLSPFDDQSPFTVPCLGADPLRHRLTMAVSSLRTPGSPKLEPADPCVGVWSYQPASGEFHRLVPLLLKSEVPGNQAWAGLADPNTLAARDLWRLALCDLLHDRLLALYDSQAAQTNANHSPWQTQDPVLHYPPQIIPVDGPFVLRDGWLYSARPFQRMALADARREALASPRTDYKFEPGELLQLLPDGKRILAADQCSLWLLEPEPDYTPVNNTPGRK